MTNELAKMNTSIIHNVDDLGRIGKMMADSGYFTDARQAAQAGVKVLAGQEMGFGAFASMTGIYIIQGKPSVGANLMASAVKANPKYDYRIRELSGEVCKIEFFEINNGKRESIGVSEFTLKEAKTAGVKNLDKYPRNMLFARAMSNGIRWYCPDVFSGNVTYTPEELGADVDEEGYVISEQKSQTPVEATPEPVIEAEIVEPINYAIESENPVESQDGGKYDANDIEVLKNWKRRSELPSMHINHAMKMSTEKGMVFGEAHPYKLIMVMNAYLKRLSGNVSDEVKEATTLKLSAINEVLTKMQNEWQMSQMPKDPFTKGD